ncbi:MAG TPA: hypothetical protein VFH73_05395 [Polyangia bacterium]|jgi:hypothetical protein|nr:hypothetical protein [Polyangia bacterium]
MRALKQTAGRFAIVLAMVAVALSAGAGCSDDFEPYSRLSSLRVLGIAGDPAAPATGETTTLSALVFTPTDEPVTYAWSWCPVPGPSRGGYQCLITEAEANGLLGGGVPPYDLGKDSTATFTNSLPPAFLKQACTPNPQNPIVFNCSKGFPVQIKVVVTTPSKPEGIVAVKTLNLRFDAATPANGNPKLGGLIATIAGVEVAITDDSDPTVTLPRSAETEIKVGLLPEEAELYTLPPDPKQIREYLLLSWFVESGDIDNARTAYQFNAELKETVPIDRARTNKWKPGKLADYPGQLARIVVVVRDGREGVSLVRGRVRLGDVQ